MVELVPFETLMQRTAVLELARRQFGMGDGDTPDFIAQFLAVTMVCGVAGPEEDIQAPPRNPSTPPAQLGYARDGCAVFYVVAPGEPGVYVPWVCTFSLGASVSFTFRCAGDPSQFMYEDDSWNVPGTVVAPPVANADGTVTVSSHVPAGSPQATTADLGWADATHALLAGSLWLPVRAAAMLGA